MTIVQLGRRRDIIGDATSFPDAGENRDLRFGRGSLRGFQEGRLVVIEPDLSRGLLGLFGKSGDGLGPADFLSGDAKVASRKAGAAFMAMATAVFPLAFILRNLPRLNSALLHGEFRVLGHLLGALADRQLSTEQVLGDGPHARLDVIEIDKPDENAGDTEQLQRLDPMPAGDENEAALAL